MPDIRDAINTKLNAGCDYVSGVCLSAQVFLGGTELRGVCVLRTASSVGLWGTSYERKEQFI